MAGEAGALGRAFVEIHVPVEAFASRMAAAGTTFASVTSKMIAESQLASSAIHAANTSVVTGYAAVAAAAGGVLTAEELAILSTNGLSLAFHHSDVAARAAAAGGVLLTGSLNATTPAAAKAATGLNAVGASGKVAATGIHATTFSLKSLMVMAKSALPIMAAFMAVQKTLGMAAGATDAQREFNKELFQLWTLTDLDARGIEALGDEIRDLTYDYNVMAAAGTKAMYQIYSATFFAADATEILGVGMKAAAAGVTDVMAAVDMTTTVLNAYGMAASESARINDLLFTAVRYGKTTYSELAGQFGRLAGVAAPAGARLEEMAAAIATLTRQGIMTDWAVTSLRQTIMQMFRPTGKLAKVIKDLGYETGRSLIQQNGFAGALKLIKEEADKTGMPLENLFTNVRAITAVLPLLTTASVGFALDIERMSMATGTMDVAFQKVAQSWDYRIEVLKSQLNDMALTVGETLLPAIEAFLEVVATLGEGFEAIADFMGPLGEFFASLAGYMTAGAVAGGILAAAIWGVQRAFTALMAHPIVAGIMAVSTAIGLVVGAVRTLTTETDEASAALRSYLELRDDLPKEEAPRPAPSPIDMFEREYKRFEWERLSGFAGEATGMASARYDREREILLPLLVAEKEVGEHIEALLVEIRAREDYDAIRDPEYVMNVLAQSLYNLVRETAAGYWPELAQLIVTTYSNLIPGGLSIADVRDWQRIQIQRSEEPAAGPSALETFLGGPRDAQAMQLPAAMADAMNQMFERELSPGQAVLGTLGAVMEEISGLYLSIQEGTVIAKEGETQIEAINAARARMNELYEDTKEWLKTLADSSDITEQQAAAIELNMALMERFIGEMDTYASETRFLIEVFKAAEDGSIAQAQALDDLIGRYGTLTGWVETLSDVEKEANAEIIGLIEALELLGITADKTTDRLIDVIAGLVSGIGGLISKFGGEGAAELGNIVTSGGGFIGAIGAATAVGAGPVAAGAALVSGFDFIFTIIAAAASAEAAAEEEMLAEEKEALDNMLAASDAVVSSFWSLVESAESVAEIQKGLAQLQVNIMSTLLGFLWPLAGILEGINELFVLQEEVVKKEVEARQKLLSNLNVPLGFPINRIRFAAATPGEPLSFADQEPEVDEELAALLEWWQEALEPFRNEILGMIQPIAEFRDSMRELWIDLIPSILGAIEPVVATFAWTLGTIDAWMHDVFAPDLEEFAKGFRDFWTERVDPWWTEEVWPQIGEWLDTIYGWLGAIVDFFSDEGWTFLSEDVWGAVKPFVKAVLDMFQEFGEWVDENWDDIKDNLLKKLGEVLGDITGDLDTVLTNIKAWLLGTDIDEDEMTDWQWLMSAISTALGFLRQASESAAAAIQFLANVIGQIFNVFIGAFNLFTGVLNAMFWWAGVDIPSVPYFDWQEMSKGGIAMEAMPAIIGDVPEAIIPLNQLSRMLSVQPGAAGMTGFGGIGTPGGIGGSAVTINVNLSQQRLNTIMLREMTSANVNDAGVGFAPIRVG